MTTPEAFRRRQRIEGTFLVIIGILLIVSTLWFRHQDNVQRACLSQNFTQLSDSLTARGNLADRDARLNRQELRAQQAESRANREFYRDVFAATTQAEGLQAYGDYRVRIAAVDKKREGIKMRRERVAQEREDNPIPAFPEGTCD